MDDEVQAEATDFALHTEARNAYYQSVLDRTSAPTTRKAYFREDYVPEDHRSLVAEYYDWLDDIAYSEYDQMELLKDFIYGYLAQRKQKILCGDHHHIFYAGAPTKHDVPESYDGERVIIFPDSDYSHDLCWYKQLRQGIVELPRDVIRTAATLPRCNAQFMDTLVPLKTKIIDAADARYEVEEVQPFTFQQFRQKWWAHKTRFEAERALMDIPSVAKRTNLISLTPPKPTTRPNIVVRHTSGRVAADHSFHVFMQHCPSPGLALALINESRTRCGPQYRISLDMLNRAMKNCQPCKRSAHLPKRGLSQVGLYYSPPGGGKSTAQTEEIIIAIDTDWIAEYSPPVFHETLATFLFHNMPVVTNQHSLATSCGLKMAGSYNLAHLRLNPATGLPYTSESEIRGSIAHQDPDLACIVRRAPGHYFAHDFPMLLFLQYLGHHTQWRFFHRNKGHQRYRPNIPDKEVPRLTPNGLVKEIEKYPVPWNAWALTRPDAVREAKDKKTRAMKRL